MTIGMCGICYNDEVELFPSVCKEKPETVHGPIGMYHCPDCGTMVLASFEHPSICAICRDLLLEEQQK